MFAIRVHIADQPGHSVKECSEYRVVPNGGGVDVVMQTSDGERVVELRRGSIAFVMNQTGKTVDVIRSRRPDGQKQAQLRGGVSQ